MLIEKTLFFLLLLVIGLITTFRDIYLRKIENRWILTGIFGSLFLYLFHAGSVLLTAYEINPSEKLTILLSRFIILSNVDKGSVNFLLSSIAAYSLWYVKLWGAGDAKLFICYTAIIPLQQYHKIYFSYYFASFYLLSCIFIPPTLFFIIKHLFYNGNIFKFLSFQKKIHEFFIKNVSLKNSWLIFKNFLGFLFIFFISNFLNQEVSRITRRITIDQNILTIILLLSFRKLTKIFNKYLALLAVVFSILLGYIYITKQNMILGYFILEFKKTIPRTIGILFLYPLLKTITNFYTKETSKGTIPFAPWMFLGALIVWFF